jgi:hypothetical protein
MYDDYDRIRRTCVDKFGAEPKRKDGVRYLEFNSAKLEKVRAAYDFPDKVVILNKEKRLKPYNAKGDKNDELS